MQKTLRLYVENKNWQLYLWKKGEDFVGLIGIEVDEQSFVVRHASVNPSFRGEGIGRAMVEKVQQLMEPIAMQAAPETEAALAKCLEQKDQG
ncbi:GNAT family N-acetyltransferase [Planomicrobium sp. Y74]|uniref:GNAT family N-acetyltransferase n=1 Tax=Planomicrobium sp. Y74 TaxID=2478977 RepID=UPI0026961E52